MINEQNLNEPATAHIIDELLCGADVVTAYQARFDIDWPAQADNAGLTAPRYLEGLAKEYMEEVWQASVWYPRNHDEFRGAIQQNMDRYPAGITARMHARNRGYTYLQDYDVVRNVYEAADETTRERGVPEVLLLDALRYQLVVRTKQDGPRDAADFLSAQRLPSDLRHAMHVMNDDRIEVWVRQQEDAAIAIEGMQFASTIIAVNALRVTYDNQLLKRALAARKLGKNAALQCMEDIIEHASSPDAGEAMLEHIDRLEQGKTPRSGYRTFYPHRLDSATKQDIADRRRFDMAARFDARLPQWIADSEAAVARAQRIVAEEQRDVDHPDQFLYQADEHHRRAQQAEDASKIETQAADQARAKAEQMLRQLGGAISDNPPEPLPFSLPSMLLKMHWQYRQQLERFSRDEIEQTVELVTEMRAQSPEATDAALLRELESHADDPESGGYDVMVVQILHILSQDASGNDLQVSILIFLW